MAKLLRPSQALCIALAKLNVAAAITELETSRTLINCTDQKLCKDKPIHQIVYDGF